jgi:hypothetical protein
MSDTTNGSAGNGRQVLLFVRRMVETNRAELNRADVKASQGLGAAGVVGITMFTAIASHAWSPESSGRAVWMWWSGWTLWTVAISTLILALMPRLGTRVLPGQAPLVTYFGDVHRLSRTADLGRALALAARQPLPAALHELAWTSSAVIRKYRLIRVGLGALAGSAALLMASVL